jgi:hypothetical protein
MEGNLFNVEICLLKEDILVYYDYQEDRSLIYTFRYNWNNKECFFSIRDLS